METMQRSSITFALADEPATLALGARLAAQIAPPCIVFLQGQLGAGKTTLSRGLLQALGHSGSVKSPTYTLVEPYQLDTYSVYHFDLYRLGDPEELEFLGVRDYLEQAALLLFEWPERGQGWLPAPDLSISLTSQPQGIDTVLGRTAVIDAHSATGQAVLRGLAA